MEIISQVWRSDLALLELAGMTIEHRPTHVLVSNGLLLLRRAPLRHDMPRLFDLIERSFPGAPHVAVGVDDPQAVPADLSRFEDAGFVVTDAIALRVDASTVRPTLTGRFDVRPLASEEDWAARSQLLRSAHPSRPVPHDQVAAERRLEATGQATWWGGFDGLRLVGSAGIVVALPHLSRCQGVTVDLGARGTGLASALVAASVQHAWERGGASTAMVLADRGHAAIGLYEEIGFRPFETQVRAARTALSTS